MATTGLADINKFQKYTVEKLKALKVTSDVLGSGIRTAHSELKSILQVKGSGSVIQIPSISATVGGTWTDAKDTSGTHIIGDKLGSEMINVITTYKNKSIDLAVVNASVEKEGYNLDEAALRVLANEEKLLLEGKFASILIGVIDSIVTKNASDTVLDLGATVLTYDALVDADALSYADAAYLVLNKKTFARFKKDKGATYIPADKEFGGKFDTIDGKAIVISKNIADGTVALFEAGSVFSEDVDAAKGKFALETSETDGGGSGIDSFIIRTINAMGIRNFSYTGTQGITISAAELEDGANWTRVGSTDECPVVVLKGALA